MKKTLFFSVLAVVLLSVGIGAILYAISQKTTFSPTTLSPEKERVFEFIPNDARYDPEQHKCVAYAYICRNPHYLVDGDEREYIYIITTEQIDYWYGYSCVLLETLEGELMDCVECQYRCSAYYDLCQTYNVEPEDTPVP